MSAKFKHFIGANNILIKFEDGRVKLLPKEYIAVYNQIQQSQIKEKHIKKFLNNK
jgi:hypothetical protein|tara:strand:+ start:109 stop:273 length:165 start_codon:yes stop_codon:yes gene_type:complete